MRRRDAVESGTIKFEFTSGAAGELARRDGRERLRRRGDAGAGAAGVDGHSPQLVGEFKSVHGRGVEENRKDDNTSLMISVFVRAVS